MLPELMAVLRGFNEAKYIRIYSRSSTAMILGLYRFIFCYSVDLWQCAGKSDSKPDIFKLTALFLPFLHYLTKLLIYCVTRNKVACICQSLRFFLIMVSNVK